jgi:hypothetical protein
MDGDRLCPHRDYEGEDEIGHLWYRLASMLRGRMMRFIPPTFVFLCAAQTVVAQQNDLNKLWWNFIMSDELRTYVCIDTQNLTLKNGGIAENKLKPRRMTLVFEIGQEPRQVTVDIRPFPRGGEVSTRSSDIALYYEPGNVTLSDNFQYRSNRPFIGELRVWKSRATFSISAASKGGFDVVTAECDLIVP